MLNSSTNTIRPKSALKPAQMKSDLQLRRETVQLYAQKVREINAMKLANQRRSATLR